MKHLYFLMTICFLIILFSCSSKTGELNIEKENSQRKNLTEIQPVLIDYKSDTYKIYIGDKYYENDSIITWRWNAECDLDGNKDSSGNDFFFYLGEPLINYNNQDWLPTLYIETNKNIITSFSCSLSFKLEDKADASKMFLRELSQLFTQLNKVEIINAILNEGFYQKDMDDYVESFELKISEDLGYDIFVYSIETKNIW